MSGAAICVQVTPDCPVEASIYGYYPSLPANAFFVAFFGLCFLLNLGFGIWYRTWTYMIALCLACLTETIGYIGRILLHNNPWSEIGFQMQICCLILAPAFNSAAIYLTLKHFTLVFGPQWAVLRPALYTYIFITGDLLSLILQAVGGGMAATAQDNQKQQDTGTDIMIAGICWQVVTLFLFGGMAVWYTIRRYRALPQHPLSPNASETLHHMRFQMFAAGTIAAFIVVFARCVYRIAEMAGGWGNPIMRDEPSYIAMEGCMIVIAVFAQTFFHPGFCFPQLASRSKSRPIDKNTKSECSDQDSELQQPEKTTATEF